MHAAFTFRATIKSLVFLSSVIILQITKATPACSQSSLSATTDNTAAKTKKKTASELLANRFLSFSPDVPGSYYSIMLCADLPDNNRPARIHVRDETGHVFIVLSKCISGSADTLRQVFGFYPRRPASCIVFKNVRSLILNNGNREYNVSVSKEITAEEFRLVSNTAVKLASKRYNLNKYNCYDYALEVFNSLPSIEKIPLHHMRFPMLLGRGGSPCCLYKDLMLMKNNNSAWAPYISFGIFVAPESTTY